MVLNKLFTKEYWEDILNDDRTKSSWFDFFILSLILISSLIYIFESLIISKKLFYLFGVIDYILLVIFVFEFIFRIFVNDDLKKHFSSPYTWFDFLAIFPFLFGFGNYKFLRILRFFRVFRVFKFFRYSTKYLSIKTDTKRFSIESLFVIRILFSLLLFIFITTALIFTFENKINPKINTFFDATYFTIVTIAAVGYGDITPVTFIGRNIIIITILFSLIIIPWHMGSLFKFLSVNSQKKNINCDNCDLDHHDVDSKHCRNCGSKL